jgi:enoyl-CoA hydratase/carnithine racemase
MEIRMADDTNIMIDIAEGIQTIRLSRPEKKNAISTAMYQSMTEALRAGDSDDAVRVNLFIGTEGCFTAGNDINDFFAASNKAGFAATIFAFLEALVRTQKPLVAAVDGEAIGIGTTMLFHMDLVYASEAAMFRTPFIDLGLVPEGGSSLLMPRAMGHVRAFEMLCLGTPCSALKAHAAGFVNEVVAVQDLEPTARQNAAKLAAKAPEALRLARQLLRGDEAALLGRIHDEGRLFMDRLTSAEARQAFQAFIEKRPAHFNDAI